MYWLLPRNSQNPIKSQFFQYLFSNPHSHGIYIYSLRFIEISRRWGRLAQVSFRCHWDLFTMLERLTQLILHEGSTTYWILLIQIRPSCPFLNIRFNIRKACINVVEYYSETQAIIGKKFDPKSGFRFFLPLRFAFMSGSTALIISSNWMFRWNRAVQ